MKSPFTIALILFIAAGGLYLFGSGAMFVGLQAPGEASTGSYERMLGALLGLGFGIVYLITAFGWYKRNSLSRALAMILVIWNLVGAISDSALNPGIVKLVWLSAAVLVPMCLFAASIRAEFVSADKQERVA
jgi:hypothetical protein